MGRLTTRNAVRPEILQPNDGGWRRNWPADSDFDTTILTGRRSPSVDPVPRGAVRDRNDKDEEKVDAGAQHFSQYSCRSHDPEGLNAQVDEALMVRRVIPPTSNVAVLAALGATAIVVVMCERLFGFPPLVLFVVPIALAAVTGRLGVVSAAVIASALIGDYLFIEPRYQVTVHAQGLRLIVYFALGAVFATAARHHLDRA